MKKVFFMTCALVAAFVLTSCEQAELTPEGDTTQLWIAGEDGSDLLGFINGSGKMVIPAELQEAFTFSCGWALVKENGKYQYINPYGQAAKNVPSTSTFYRHFYYNLLTFKSGGLFGKWNTNFREVIPAQYYGIGPNTDAGLMWFSNGSKVGFVNAQGGEVIKAQFDYTSSFSGGCCVVGVDQSSGYRHYGLIDTKGNYLIPLQESALENLGQGRIAFLNNTNSKWGICSTSGQVILPAKYGYISAYSCGLAMVEDNGEYGYIDMNGREVIEPEYRGAMDFVEDVAWVQETSESKIELINKNGAPVMELEEDVYPQSSFRNGLALIYNSDTKENSYINKNKQVVYQWTDNSNYAPARQPSLREIGLRALAGTPVGVLYTDRTHGICLTQEGEIVYKD